MSNTYISLISRVFDIKADRYSVESLLFQSCLTSVPKNLLLRALNTQNADILKLAVEHYYEDLTIPTLWVINYFKNDISSLLDLLLSKGKIQYPQWLWHYITGAGEAADQVSDANIQALIRNKVPLPEGFNLSSSELCVAKALLQTGQYPITYKMVADPSINGDILFFELYTKYMSNELAQNIFIQTIEKNNYPLVTLFLTTHDPKQLTHWIKESLVASLSNEATMTLEIALTKPALSATFITELVNAQYLDTALIYIKKADSDTIKDSITAINNAPWNKDQWVEVLGILMPYIEKGEMEVKVEIISKTVNYELTDSLFRLITKADIDVISTSLHSITQAGWNAEQWGSILEKIMPLVERGEVGVTNEIIKETAKHSHLDYLLQFLAKADSSVLISTKDEIKVLTWNKAEWTEILKIWTPYIEQREIPVDASIITKTLKYELVDSASWLMHIDPISVNCDIFNKFLDKDTINQRGPIADILIKHVGLDIMERGLKCKNYGMISHALKAGIPASGPVVCISNKAGEWSSNVYKAVDHYLKLYSGFILSIADSVQNFAPEICDGFVNPGNGDSYPRNHDPFKLGDFPMNHHFEEVYQKVLDAAEIVQKPYFGVCAGSQHLILKHGGSLVRHNGYDQPSVKFIAGTLGHFMTLTKDEQNLALDQCKFSEVSIDDVRVAHSYAGYPQALVNVELAAYYQKEKIVASTAHGMQIGTQFHPEDYATNLATDFPSCVNRQALIWENFVKLVKFRYDVRVEMSKTNLTEEAIALKVAECHDKIVVSKLKACVDHVTEYTIDYCSDSSRQQNPVEKLLYESSAHPDYQEELYNCVVGN